MGNGTSFCAGADLHDMQATINATPQSNKADAMVLHAMLTALNTLPQPVVGLIHGPVFGGGIGLVSACDIALAMHDSRFCLSEVKLGLLPAVISPLVLPKLGYSAFRRYSLSAEVFSAHTAKQLGLIHEVYDTNESMESACDSLLGNLLTNAPPGHGGN
jgi:methylglutaconyl-CoA hydratase